MLEDMRESLWAFRRVFEYGSLRRLQLAWAGSNVGAWAYTIAIAVYAFGQDGAYAVGLIGLARWVTAGSRAPDRGARRPLPEGAADGGDRSGPRRAPHADGPARGRGGPPLAVYVLSSSAP